MFTSNGKFFSKRDFGSHLDSGLIGLAGSYPDLNRGYNEDLLGRPSVRTGHSSESDVNFDDHLDRRFPPRSSSNREYEEDGDQWTVRRRNGSRRMYGKDAHIRGPCIRHNVFDEGSSVSSDYRYGDSLRFAKTPPDYLSIAPESQMPPDFSKTPPEFIKIQSHGGNKSRSNQLLNLRAALNEKELQLVELREQHITVLNRVENARQNWEEALKSKDRVILQLQRALQHKKSQLDRQERENQENLQALRKEQEEEDVEVQKKELKVALLEAKNAQFVQELVEQQKLITSMKRHVDEKEELCASQYQKLEMMNGRVQDLKAALQEKEEEADTQLKYCNEMKTLLWKRDSIIGQLQLSEQKFQSTLARQEAAREAVVVSRDKIQVEKSLVEKRLLEMQNQFNAKGSDGSRSGHERAHHRSEMRDLDDRGLSMRRMQKCMLELQRSVTSKDNALTDKNNEHQQALQEIQRMTEDYDGLKQEYEEVYKRNNELEISLAQLQDYTHGRMGASMSDALTPPVEELPYEFSQDEAIGEDLGIYAMLDTVESKQLLNASVYHANFEKIKINEVEKPDIDPQPQEQEQEPPAPPPQPQSHVQLPPLKTLTPPPGGRPVSAAAPPRPSSPLDLQNDTGGLSSELDANYKSIHDEIMKRERCWRKTEELMRAALTRRMKLLEETKEVHTSETDVTWSANTGMELHDRSRHFHDHQHYFKEETSARGNTDHKTWPEQQSQIERRKQSDDRNILYHHIPRRKALHEDGHKHHGADGVWDQRQTFEQDVYLGKTIQEVVRFKKFDDGSDRRHEQGMFLDRRKSANRTNQQYCKYSEHFGHYERTTNDGRIGRTLKGRFP